MLDPVPGQSRGVNDPENARVDEVQRPATEIDLVQDDDLWPFRQTGPVLAELVIDRRETFLPVVRGRLDDMEKQADALEVREELVAEADPLVRSLEEPGDVCDRQLAPVGRLDRPEDRRDRGEGVLGHLRL